jgi:capsular polysaccharide biosynthesis protein
MNDMDNAATSDAIGHALDRLQEPPAGSSPPRVAARRPRRPAREGPARWSLPRYLSRWPSPLPREEATPWKRPEAWNIAGVAPEEPGDPAGPIPTLVSFHYLRAAVRRRWRFCALFALVGMLLAVAFLVAGPASPTATTTLRLTHGEQAEPSGAVATDISLLATRTVAERTISALGLTMSPEDLKDSVKAEPTGSAEILHLNMTASTNAEAVRRLEAFTKEYLDFRAKQMSAQSDILIQGYSDQIATLQSRVKTLSAQIETADEDADRLSAITERAQANEAINGLQEAVQDATLRQNAVVQASGIIDPPAPMSPGGLRRVLLVLVSGMIGGVAIGFGVVVLQAILSDRLRLRIEVASALNASVLLSVRRIEPLPLPVRIVTFLPWVGILDGRRAVDRQRMAHALEKAVPEPGGRQSLAVLCLGNADEMRFALVAAAVALQRHGRTVTIIDLTETGRVASAVARRAGTPVEESPEVFRPSAIPSLAKGPSYIDSADWENVALEKGGNGVTLILADFDPAVGVDHLTAWTDCVVVAVTSGKSSVELVRTAGDLIRSVDLRLRGAVLLKAVRDDVSSGIAAERPAKMPEPKVSLSDSNAERSHSL